MRLDQPFYRLPVRFDVQRLRAEVDALPPDAWADHPNNLAGNRSLRLISVEGGDNDEVNGVMRPTPHLSKSPYLLQVLASFGVVWSRSRLLKLEPFAGVPQHADINYHWFNRVRVHIPIITHPDIRFFCGDESVHMAAGETWIFDNWRLHRVENPIGADRIHLVADTAGTSSFWQFVASASAAPAIESRYDPTRTPQLLTEQISLRPVMPPAEVDLLLQDLLAELTPGQDSPEDQLPKYSDALHSFRRDWRQLYQLYGESLRGRAEFVKLRDSLRTVSRAAAGSLMMRTNRVPVHNVLEGRVLLSVLPPPQGDDPGIFVRRQRQTVLQRPIFIVAAPRSGSTLLFETLAASDEICTLGGEAHWLVEDNAELRLGAAGVESNRLTATHGNDELALRIEHQIYVHLQDSRGRPVPADSALRFLEKTPKNALRIPFFDRLFPDALFVFLWRDPLENLSSIMQAWRSGNWRTYDQLPGFAQPWSLLLPPLWPSMRDQPLERIAAFQWESTNRIVLDDLATLSRDRWSVVQYSDLVADPQGTLRTLCDFAGLRFAGGIVERLSGPLPLSRYTQTAPAAGKWRQNEALIRQVLPTLENTWARLRTLASAHSPNRYP